MQRFHGQLAKSCKASIRSPFMGDWMINRLPPMAKIALITGVTGQDGSYLAELLLEKGVRGARHQAPRQQLQHQPR